MVPLEVDAPGRGGRGSAVAAVFHRADEPAGNHPATQQFQAPEARRL